MAGEQFCEVDVDRPVVSGVGAEQRQMTPDGRHALQRAAGNQRLLGGNVREREEDIFLDGDDGGPGFDFAERGGQIVVRQAADIGVAPFLRQ